MNFADIVPKGPIKNNLALVQMIVLYRSGDKPLFEPAMIILLAHICVNELYCVILSWNIIDIWSIYCEMSPAILLLSHLFLGENYGDFLNNAFDDISNENTRIPRSFPLDIVLAYGEPTLVWKDELVSNRKHIVDHKALEQLL